MMPAMPNDLHETVQTRLRRVGQRYTPKRRALVDSLGSARTPLSIGDVMASSAGLPQSSAYRNLAVLEQAGVVRRVVTEEGYARFELTEDLTEHHHHLICRSCGLTVEIEASDVEQWARRTAAQHGFSEAEHVVDIFGLCAACAQNRASERVAE